jgi:NAD(P)-dependent dehydrogenase (short-subunit alcohol dehydrogenase family)
MRLEGKGATITGGASGIGHTIAERFSVQASTTDVEDLSY